MASHTITACIAAFLIATVTSQDSLCPTNVAPLSMKEAFEQADNVLLGMDVSNLAGCQANDGSCSRRQILFQVQCILKKKQDLVAWDFSQPVTIGVNRSVQSCDRTFFGYGPSQPMVVMVTAKKFAVNRPYLDWHEVNNATRAHYIYGENLEMALGLTCDIKSPYDESKDFCRVGQTDCCASRCRVNVPLETDDAPDTESARVWFSAETDDSVGVHCCKQLRAGAVSNWATDDNNEYNNIMAHAFDSNPLPVVEVSRTAYRNVLPDERLAVAMYTMVKNGTMEKNGTETYQQVLWLVANVDVIQRPDAFYQLNTAKGVTLVNYTMVLPRKRLPVHLKVFRHARLPSTSNIDVSKYMDACLDSEDNYLPSCIFMLNDFLEAYDNDTKLLATVDLFVRPDDWSVWNAIKHYDATPRSACPLIIEDLVPYKDTVLCPTDLTKISLGVSTVSSTSLLMFALSAILFFVNVHFE